MSARTPGPGTRFAAAIACALLAGTSWAQHPAHSGHGAHAAPADSAAHGARSGPEPAQAAPPTASPATPPVASPYAGQESRAIKSLSAQDIDELQRGGGWGLARAAELNGVPGPAHLLELADQIPLSEAQRSAIRRIHEQMRADAIVAGERLIALERELEARFRDRSITDPELRRLLGEIEHSRRALRYVHLSTHLKTPALLTEQQIARYNALRGYGGDPCALVPAGHDPALWRRHNGCNRVNERLTARPDSAQ